MNKMNPFAGSNKGRSWFWWGINIGILVGVIIWWWRQNQSEGERKTVFKFKPLTITKTELEQEITIDQKTADEPAAEPEDLKVIEGLGPKSAQALQAVGIHTFSALAGMSSDEIHGVLKAANVRVPFPETWPEQAALAAAGKWKALKNLQSKLTGGRKT